MHSKRTAPLALELLDEKLVIFETPKPQLNFVRAKLASHVA